MHGLAYHFQLLWSTTVSEISGSYYFTVPEGGSLVLHGRAGLHGDCTIAFSRQIPQIGLARTKP